MSFKSMKALDFNGNTVIFREDLNVLMKNNWIFNDKRIQTTLPTLKLALEKGVGVVVLSLLDRPSGGEYAEEVSLKPVAERLCQELGLEVNLVKAFEEAKVKHCGVCVLENVRFNKGEKNSSGLVARYVALGDIYVMDAFATANRAQASTEGAIRCAKEACVGLLLQAEIEEFAKVLDDPRRPLVAIVVGFKVSTNLDCTTTCSSASMRSSSAAASPTPSSQPRERTSAPPCMSRISSSPLGNFLPRPKNMAAGCPFPSTSWWPKSWLPASRLSPASRAMCQATR